MSINGMKGNGDSAAGARVHGFTLVELAAVIVTLCIIGSLVLPAMARARQRSVLTGCQSNLRQVGLALQMYVDSQNGLLPGPLTAEVQSRYDDSSRNEMAWYLAEGLGSPRPCVHATTAPVLVCPASRPTYSPKRYHNGLTCYLLNEDIDREKKVRIPAFGSPGTPALSPLTLAEVSEYGSPTSIFAVTDADKGNVNPKAPCWQELPYAPAHGKERNQLMFDWHVESRRW